MTEGTLHPAPRGRDVVREQVRIVGLSLRREALGFAVVLAIVTFVIAIDIVRGNAESWFDSDEWAPIALASFVFPFAVWWRERRFGPAFLWTLPVDRRRLALAKVFAGWVWLMTAVAVVVVWQLALALLARVPDAETVSPVAVMGATAMYLLGSALVLGLRHPLRWLIGTVAVLFSLPFLNEALGLGPDGRLEELLSSSGVFSAARDVVTFWLDLPRLAQWAIWIGAGLAALWAAVSRHGERRPH